MQPLALEGIHRIIAGLLLGTAFGFFLVQSELAWRKTVLEQLSMKNGKFFKIIFASLAIGPILFYLAKNYGIVQIQTRPSFFWGAVIGGMLFASGIVLCGQFPASAVASIAAGKTYSIWTLAGMLLALPSVHFLSKWLSRTVYNWPPPSFYAERIEKMFAGYTNIYYTVAIFSAILFLFFQFIQTGSDNSEETQEKG